MNAKAELPTGQGQVASPVGTTIGYSLTYVMDYGNGRQVQITGTMPLGAKKELFDKELDMLRESTDRQQSFVILRDRKARLAAEKKMVAAIDHMLATYEKESDAEIERMSELPNKNHTVAKAQIEGMRAQAANYKQMKMEERMRHQAEIDVCEVIIAGAEKEIGG